MNKTKDFLQDTVRIAPVIDRMRGFGVKSILDYSVEEDITQEEAEEREMELVDEFQTSLQFQFMCVQFKHLIQRS